MTREEIIECYSEAVYSTGLAAAAGNENAMRDYELLKAGFDALRGPTREMVERMRGEWEAVPRFGVYDTACSKCGYSPGIRFFSSDFCPACGAPMTDEAVDMTMKKLEEMRNDQ